MASSEQTLAIEEGEPVLASGEPLTQLSVVIPVYNERENIAPLHEALTQALAGRSYDLIFVDDGSIDGSRKELRRLVARDSLHVRLIELRRNFGQTAAIAAGIDHSNGDVVVTIDADMQNDPADIPMLLDKIEEGFDVASGWRVDRKDRFLTRRIPSRIANWLISAVTGVKLHDYGCTLKAYRREVLEGFRLYGEMHRFIPAYAGGVGADIVEVPVQHHPRTHGEAKYGLERTVKVVLDLLTVKFLMSYANKPIYLFGGAGVLVALGGAGMLTFLAVRRLVDTTSVTRSPMFPVSIMLVILGFQSVLMGLIAELLVRTYHESQAKPTYSIREVHNADES
ncbi:MAG: glycosyltransferase family 2 protein [Anaerolineales bacterium]